MGKSSAIGNKGQYGVGTKGGKTGKGRDERHVIVGRESLWIDK